MVLALLGVAVACFALGDSFALNILADHLSLWPALATAWNIIGGFGGQFSLGHGVFFAVGAYLTANLFLHAGLSPWLSLVPAAALAALIAYCDLLADIPAARARSSPSPPWPSTRWPTCSPTTSTAVTGGAARHPRAVPRRPRQHDLPDRMSYALLMLGFLVVCLIVVVSCYRSRLGYYLQAVRDNEDAARAPRHRRDCATKLAGMAISAALTGIGGSLFMMYVRVVDPPTLLTLSGRRRASSR